MKQKFSNLVITAILTVFFGGVAFGQSIAVLSYRNGSDDIDFSRIQFFDRNLRVGDNIIFVTSFPITNMSFGIVTNPVPYQGNPDASANNGRWSAEVGNPRTSIPTPTTASTLFPNGVITTGYYYTLSIPSSWNGCNDIQVKFWAGADDNGGRSVAAYVTLRKYNFAPPQPGMISGPTTVCIGDEKNYSISEVAGATSYKWNHPLDWTGYFYPSSERNAYFTPGVNAQDGYITVTAHNDCGSSSRSLSVTVNKPPTAPTSITGTKTIDAGQSTMLKAEGGSEGSGCTYEWRSSGCSSGIALGTGVSFTTPALSSNTTYYVRRVGNSACTAATTCTAESITVKPIINTQIPSITAQPKTATYTQNQTATALSVTAEVTDGGTLSYQWYSNTTSSASGGTPIGTNSNTYTPPTTATGTLYYYVVVTNTNNSVNGTKTATFTSNAIKITVDEIVNAQPPNIGTQPQTATYTQNATATPLSVMASVTDGGTLSYQWYSNTTSSTSGGTPIGTNSNTYTPPTTATGTLYYYVAVTNTNNSVNGTKTATTTSSVAMVTVNTLVNAQNPSISAEPKTAIYIKNATATALSVTASVTDGGTLSYQWYSNTTSSTSGGTPIGTNSNTYTPPTTATGTLYYYVVVTNTNNSVNGTKIATTTSSVVAVTVENATVLVIDVTISGCLNTNLAVGETRQLSATVQPTTATNKSVSWTSNNTAVATVNSSTGVVTAVSAGTARITITTADGGKTDYCDVTVVNATLPCNDIPPLLGEIKWDQCLPYNAKCPTVAGSGNGYAPYAPAGCVAIAMGQIMKFHRHPSTRTESIIPPTGSPLSPIYGTTTYQWSNMQPTYGVTYSGTTQENAVATLIKEIGVAVNMRYGAGGSTSSSTLAVSAFQTYFGYHSNAKSRTAYPNNNDWEQLILDELRAGRPVFYGGTNTTPSGGGHAFVCDGYNCNDKKFNINWGWGDSKYDGYFVLSALNLDWNNDGIINENYVLNSRGEKIYDMKFNQAQTIIFAEPNLEWASFYASTSDNISTFAITANADGEGFIIPEGTLNIHSGMNQAYAFDAQEGYEIDKVYINGRHNETAKVNGYYIFEDVRTNQSIEVTFKPITIPTVNYVISASAGTNGSITPSGDISVSERASKTFAFEANSGYEIDLVLIDGTHNETAKSNGYYTFLEVSENHEILVTFKEKTTGIDEIFASQLKIFPNPVRNELFIETDLTINKIEICSLIGAVVLVENNVSEKISITTLPQGVYILKIYTKKGLITTKIMKE